LIFYAIILILMNRSQPTVSQPSSFEVQSAIGEFVDSTPEITGFVNIDTKRRSNTDDPEAGQLAFFEPTTRLDVISQGLGTGRHFMVLDVATGNLAIEPPISDLETHNNLLNRAAAAASVAISGS
jgi:hypothetical protein